MAEEFYLDTSIWLDFYEKRDKNGDLALKLIIKIIGEDYKIAYSDLTIREFKLLGYTNDQVNSIFSIAKPKNIKRVHIYGKQIYGKQIEEARNLSKQRDVPRKDALHAILARDNSLQFVSRDNHFEKLKDITLTKKPEDII